MSKAPRDELCLVGEITLWVNEGGYSAPAIDLETDDGGHVLLHDALEAWARENDRWIEGRSASCDWIRGRIRIRIDVMPEAEQRQSDAEPSA